MTELVSRQGGGLTGRPAPQRPDLSERMAEAQAIASAGDAVPPAYRKPGAVLLAMHWSESHGIDLLTTIQNVAFINGRPSLSAELWEHMAQSKGFTVKIAHLDEQSCEAVLLDAIGEQVGSWITTMADANTKNSVWKQYPRQMMRANAIRNVVKFHGGIGLLGAIDTAESFEPVDAVATLTPAPDPVDVVAEQAAESPAESPAEVVEAEIVEDISSAAEAFKAAGLKASQALTAARRIDDTITSLDQLDGNDDMIAQVIEAATA